MAAHPIVVVGGGVIRIPEQLRDDPRYQDGAILELVPVHPSRAGEAAGAQQKGDWRRLRGILKDAGVDLNEDLNQERLRELAAEDRMLKGNAVGS